ncbi:MAG TPA: YHS domain-containing (seleno)protein [Gemmatimonadales bacterium]|jgi:hypothetical protein
MLFRVASVLALTAAAAAFPARAQSTAPSTKVLVNTNQEGLALQGYDPVAFFTQNHPVVGLPEITAVHRGATYRFSSTEHRALFQQEPGKYEPAFGGFCAYAVSQGGTAPVDVSTFQILHGRLVLNKNPDVLELFNRDREERYRKAEANWPGIVEKKGR